MNFMQKTNSKALPEKYSQEFLVPENKPHKRFKQHDSGKENQVPSSDPRRFSYQSENFTQKSQSQVSDNNWKTFAETKYEY